MSTELRRTGFIVLWLIIIASRIPAVSKSLLDWDETLFASGVREYDVTIHHPHPPGYPLFIAAAKLLRPLVSSDFRAVQGIATLASALLFPAAFLLARALKLRASVAIAAAVLTSFLPTVWYHGGTALSDVPAMCLALFASALLLAPRTYFAGCIVAVLAIGFRPQLLLVMAVPAILGAWELRKTRMIALSWLAGATLVALTYFGAAYFSSEFPHGFLRQIHYTTKHIEEADSLANPSRPSLRELAPRAIWFPFAGGRARWWILAFAAIGLLHALVSGHRAALILLLMFVPTALVTWMLLDPTCTPRYAVAYAPLYAFLAAIGTGAIAERLGRRDTLFHALATTLITAMLVSWTRPALQLVHDEPSPPVAAFEWVRTYVPRTGPRVFIENELGYHAQYLMSDYDYKQVFEGHDIRPEDMQPGNVLVIEGESREPGAHVFRRPRKALWQLARSRYFEGSVIPMHTMTWFEDGWYGREGDNDSWWRWMGSKAGILLPALEKSGELRMKFYVPIDTTPRPPVVTLTWNGAVIDHIRATKADLEIVRVLPSRKGTPNELGISVDVWANPKRDHTGDDSRDLGLKLTSISWQAETLQ
ncbi:MAG TPA: hypothetical protein VJZ00_18095 [Thermoanaerobaculia bacterium]|nr:hypothetical protein [Thermoanaerobaculia bacterium]